MYSHQEVVDRWVQLKAEGIPKQKRLSIVAKEAGRTQDRVREIVKENGHWYASAEDNDREVRYRDINSRDFEAESERFIVFMKWAAIGVMGLIIVFFLTVCNGDSGFERDIGPYKCNTITDDCSI